MRINHQSAIGHTGGSRGPPEVWVKDSTDGLIGGLQFMIVPTPPPPMSPPASPTNNSPVALTVTELNLLFLLTEEVETLTC